MPRCRKLDPEKGLKVQFTPVGWARGEADEERAERVAGEDYRKDEIPHE